MLKRFGHYQLLQPLAQGRCMVFEAEDTTTGRHVVVKIFANSAERGGFATAMSSHCAKRYRWESSCWSSRNTAPATPSTAGWAHSPSGKP
jgi:hypothetical protein